MDACDSTVHCAYVRGTLMVEPERTKVGAGAVNLLGRGGDTGIFAKGELLRSVGTTISGLDPYAVGDGIRGWP